MQAARVEPFIALAADLVVQGDAQIGAQNGLGAQDLPQARDRELVGVEVLGIGPEAQSGTGLRLGRLDDDFELAARFAGGVALVVLLTAMPQLPFEVLGKRVHARDLHVVQSA